MDWLVDYLVSLLYLTLLNLDMMVLLFVSVV